MTQAATLTRRAAPLAPIDVSRPEIYAEDRWQELFRRLRAEAPIQFVPESDFGAYWSVTTHKPIVHIEALPKIFSSSWEYGGISIAGGVDKPTQGEMRMPMFIAMDRPNTPPSAAPSPRPSGRARWPR